MTSSCITLSSATAGTRGRPGSAPSPALDGEDGVALHVPPAHLNNVQGLLPTKAKPRSAQTPTWATLREPAAQGPAQKCSERRFWSDGHCRHVVGSFSEPSGARYHVSRASNPSGRRSCLCGGHWESLLSEHTKSPNYALYKSPHHTPAQHGVTCSCCATSNNSSFNSG